MREAIITKPPVLDYSGTESMNTICTNLTFAGKDVKRIAITSCVASEGKSTMCARLLLNMANRGKNCVLVDCDMRRSMTVQRLGLKTDGNMTGLAHFLAGLCDLDQACYQTNYPGACIIPAGRDVTSPIPLIDSPDFSRMMDVLDQNFDYVFVDTPPIGIIVDAAEIAKYCDGVVLVIKYGERHRHEVQEAIRQMRKAGCPILGIIIDMVTVKTLSEKQYYKSHYYYSHYSEGYYKRENEAQKKQDQQ